MNAQLHMSPESNVTPQRCLPLNHLVLREQAQGWCWDVMFVFISTGNTDGPTSLVTSLSFLAKSSKDTFSNNLKWNITHVIMFLSIYHTYRFFSVLDSFS